MDPPQKNNRKFYIRNPRKYSIFFLLSYKRTMVRDRFRVRWCTRPVPGRRGRAEKILGRLKFSPFINRYRYKYGFVLYDLRHRFEGYFVLSFITPTMCNLNTNWTWYFVLLSIVSYVVNNSIENLEITFHYFSITSKCTCALQDMCCAVTLM
jgi:hypothetical protein